MGTARAAEGKIRHSALGCFSVCVERDGIIHALELREQEMEGSIRYRWIRSFPSPWHISPLFSVAAKQGHSGEINRYVGLKVVQNLVLPCVDV